MPSGLPGHSHAGRKRIVEPDGGWREGAACTGCDPELFFPIMTAACQEAKAICASCPVIADCLEYALTNHIYHGIWGGTTERERVIIRRKRRRNAS